MKVLAFDRFEPTSLNPVEAGNELFERHSFIIALGDAYRPKGATTKEYKKDRLPDGRYRYIWRGLSKANAGGLKFDLESEGLRAMVHEE